MDNDFYNQQEIAMDDVLTRLAAVEKALLQIPQINYEADITRPPGVKVEPAALPQGGGN